MKIRSVLRHAAGVSDHVAPCTVRWTACHLPAPRWPFCRISLSEAVAFGGSAVVTQGTDLSRLPGSVSADFADIGFSFRSSFATPCRPEPGPAPPALPRGFGLAQLSRVLGGPLRLGARLLELRGQLGRLHV